MLLATFPAGAQPWSLGVGTGAFKFGDFALRTIRAGNEGGGGPVTRTRLTAATRPGLTVDFQRDFNDRFALRLQGTFTESPLTVRPQSGRGVILDAGDVDVTTLSLPLLIHLNPHGRFKVHIQGGPAYAIYHLNQPALETTRGRFGAMAGAGVVWWWSSRFAVEGEIIDIVTSSPLRESDLVGAGTLRIPRPQNEHATLGIRWKF